MSQTTGMSPRDKYYGMIIKNIADFCVFYDLDLQRLILPIASEVHYKFS